MNETENRMEKEKEIKNTNSFYYCSCDQFQGCCWPNGKTNYCLICRFKETYYPVEVEKIKYVREIIKKYTKK